MLYLKIFHKASPITLSRPMLCTYLQAPIAASVAACALASSSSHQIYLITFCHAMADPNESRAAWRRHGVGSGEGGPLTLTHKEGEELRNVNPEHSEEFLSPNLGRWKRKSDDSRKCTIQRIQSGSTQYMRSVSSIFDCSSKKVMWEVQLSLDLCLLLAWIRNVLSCVKWFQLWKSDYEEPRHQLEKTTYHNCSQNSCEMYELIQ